MSTHELQVLAWEDPPPARQHPERKRVQDPNQNAYVATVLQEHSGKWLLVWEGTKANVAASIASQIKKALWPAFRPAGAFESTIRCTRNGPAKVWA